VNYRIIQGDCIEGMHTLADESVHCVVTSPPYYGLRDYGVEGQIGLEESPDAYVAKMVDVFREVHRILRNDGTVWLNLGDSYNGAATNRTGQNGYDDGRTNRSERFSVGGVSGLKPKDLIGIPWRVAFALQADGWYLRQDIIWHKTNPMPESVTDRCTKAHEYIFLLSKSERYYYDNEAICEPIAHANAQRTTSTYNTAERYGAKNGGNGGLDSLAARMRAGEATTRNRRSVWTVATKPYAEAHFAVYPPKLIEPCILAGCPVDGTVFDPFNGSGTTGYVALCNNRHYIGIELNPEYVALTDKRLSAIQPKMNLV
jgi:site-specific DNA-methyltransferase (adenine-specific)